MLSSSKELKNVPISFSILHEQEYNNLYLIFKSKKGKAKKRRAFSEKSDTKFSSQYIQFKFFDYRRKTLKN